MRVNNTQLFDRLQERGYAQKKIDENIECEIFGELKEEVEESYKAEIILELQSNETDEMQTNMDAVAARVNQIIENNSTAVAATTTSA